MAEVIDREELLRQLSFIKNRVTRLRKYVEHELLDVFQEELYELINEDMVYFQHGSRNDGYRQVDRGTCDKSDDADSEPIIVLAQLGVRITINGIREIFQWTDDETSDFVEMCLLRAIEVDPRNLRKQIASWAGSWEINATSKAFEQFAREDWEGRIAVHRWLVTAWWFDDIYLFCYFGDEGYQKWLGCTIPEQLHRPRDKTPIRSFDALRLDVAVVEGVVMKLEELGATRREIDELFTDWLVKYGAGGLDARWPAAMAFFGRVAYKREAEVSNQVRQRFLGRTYDTFEHLFRDVSRLDSLELHMLLNVVNWKGDEELWACFRGKIVDRLARGLIGQVSHALIEMTPYLDDFRIASCAAEAVHAALASERYGVAAALVNHFGVEVCIDPSLLAVDLEAADGHEEEARTTAVEARRTELREAAGVARQLNQPIRLKF